MLVRELSVTPDVPDADGVRRRARRRRVPQGARPADRRRRAGHSPICCSTTSPARRWCRAWPCRSPPTRAPSTSTRGAIASTRRRSACSRPTSARVGRPAARCSPTSRMAGRRCCSVPTRPTSATTTIRWGGSRSTRCPRTRPDASAVSTCGATPAVTGSSTSTCSSATRAPTATRTRRSCTSTPSTPTVDPDTMVDHRVRRRRARAAVDRVPAGDRERRPPGRLEGRRPAPRGPHPARRPEHLHPPQRRPPRPRGRPLAHRPPPPRSTRLRHSAALYAVR